MNRLERNWALNFEADVCSFALETVTTDLDLRNTSDFCCPSTRSSFCSIISLDYFLPTYKGSTIALEIVRDKTSFETLFISSIGGDKKGFANIWKYFRTNMSPWRKKQLSKLIQKSYQQYIENNKWEYWGPNIQAKPLKLTVYINFYCIQRLVRSYSYQSPTTFALDLLSQILLSRFTFHRSCLYERQWRHWVKCTESHFLIR